MGRSKKLYVTYLTPTSPLGWTSQVFNDWFDFADFIKQANLNGLDVTIHAWEYV